MLTVDFEFFPTKSIVLLLGILVNCPVVCVPYMDLVPANEICGKVMFTAVSVCHSVCPGHVPTVRDAIGMIKLVHLGTPLPILGSPSQVPDLFRLVHCLVHLSVGKWAICIRLKYFLVMIRIRK